MTAIRIKVPKTAKAGAVIELKALIQHPMETGYRLDARGEVIPRNILTKFECLYDGETIFTADLHPGVAANPLITFHTVATESGTLTFRWTEQSGTVFSDSAEMTVT